MISLFPVLVFFCAIRFPPFHHTASWNSDSRERVQQQPHALHEKLLALKRIDLSKPLKEPFKQPNQRLHIHHPRLFSDTMHTQLWTPNIHGPQTDFRNERSDSTSACLVVSDAEFLQWERGTEE